MLVANGYSFLKSYKYITNALKTRTNVCIQESTLIVTH